MFFCLPAEQLAKVMPHLTLNNTPVIFTTKHKQTRNYCCSHCRNCGISAVTNALAAAFANRNCGCNCCAMRTQLRAQLRPQLLATEVATAALTHGWRFDHHISRRLPR